MLTSLLALLLAVPGFEIVGKGEAVVVRTLTPAEAAAWKAAPPKEPADVFTLSVDKPDASPMLGEVKVADGKLVFVPRFPLVAGIKYRAVFHPDKLPGATGTASAITDTLLIPKPPRGPATFVEQVYPTADVLPENQLKVYLHFSAPMSRGEVYRNIQLLDANGKRVEHPFLEIDEELWDRDERRLTVFFDPGRIKRGLRPREEDGPILEEGKTYTLVIDAAWKDAEGNPLKEAFRKRFKAAAPDDKQPDLAAWKITPPKAGTTDPLTVTFEKCLDNALLQRLLWIEDATGKRVEGKLTVGKEERTWQWTPTAAWTPGEYKLMADTRLEDLAGNSLAKPFEVDLFRPIQRQVTAETVSRKFEIGK
jgi:hypothetical protein